MYRSSAAANNLCTKMLNLYNNGSRTHAISSRPFDVFINHRGIDTRRNVAGMLYQHLSDGGLRPFLDCKSIRPGDNLMKKIQMGIRSCRVAIAVFSPRYCESYYCLHELALILKSNKSIIPIFCNIKPEQLQVPDAKRLHRFGWALEEAKHTVGLSFDSSNGDWSELLHNVSDAVIKSLLEEDERSMLLNHTP